LYGKATATATTSATPAAALRGRNLNGKFLQLNGSIGSSARQAANCCDVACQKGKKDTESSQRNEKLLMKACIGPTFDIIYNSISCQREQQENYEAIEGKSFFFQFAVPSTTHDYKILSR